MMILVEVLSSMAAPPTQSAWRRPLSNIDDGGHSRGVLEVEPNLAITALAATVGTMNEANVGVAISKRVADKGLSSFCEDFGSNLFPSTGLGFVSNAMVSCSASKQRPARFSITTTNWAI